MMSKNSSLGFSTFRELEALKPKEKRYSVRYTPSQKLFIEVLPTGVKSWCYRYTLNGKQDKLVLGHYPDVSIKEAAQLRDEAASLVAKGISPKQDKTKPQSILFKDYGERYLEEVIKKDRKDPYSMTLYLNNDIYPMLGHLQLEQITVDDVRRTIWRKKEQGYDAAATQVRGLLKRMFDYAMTLGYVPYNPVLSIPVRHIHKAKPRDRYLSSDEIRNYYTTLLNSRVYRARKLGLMLSLLTMVRKSELQAAKWEHINFDERKWRIPKTKADSKTGHSRPMTVYMSKQVIEIFKELKTIAGDEPYVFVGRKSGTHVSHNVLNEAQKAALRLTDVAHFTVHDLRRTASTHLNEMGFNRDAIEACLNHAPIGVRGIYNQAIYEEERIEMLQKWSDYIFSVIYEPNLIFFNQARAKRIG